MKRICLLLLLFLLLPASLVTAVDEEPVVRAVLFYSPTCPHCHQVITQALPPLLDEYGERLYILLIDTSQEGGSQLYQSLVDSYEVPRERLGVPALVVAEEVLVGSVEIPERFPALIEGGLAAGGIAWPAFPGFDARAAEAVFAREEAGTESPAAPESVPAPAQAQSEMPAELDLVPPAGATTVAGGAIAVKEGLDPVGFVLAALVTLLMLGALGYVANHLVGLHRRLQRLQQGPVRTALVPILLGVGLSVSLYLSYVEINDLVAVCGPIGACNAVQTSAYARIGGVPVAVLGVLNYLLIAVLWWGQRTFRGTPLRLATGTLFALTIAGTLFSVYLTLLELFVIEAVCAWCLTSAAVTTLLMLVVASFILERVPLPEQEGMMPGLP